MIFSSKYKLLLYISFIVIIDQIFKFLVYKNLEPNEIYQITHIKSILNICYISNSGLAFGLFSDYKYIKIFIITARILFFVYIFKNFCLKNKKHLDIGWGFICGGGISNTIDFFVYNSVIDMFYFDFASYVGIEYFYNISFNLADIFILTGIIILFLYRNSNNSDNNFCKI